MRDKDFDYVYTDYFAFKAPKLDGKDLNPLVKIFDGIPQNGEVLSTYNKEKDIEQMKRDKERILDILTIPSKDPIQLIDTNLLKKMENSYFSIYAYGKKTKYTLVNKKFTDLIEKRAKYFEILSMSDDPRVIWFIDNSEILLLACYVPHKDFEIPYLQYGELGYC